MNRKATIRDIALKLDVTASTVSRALKNSPRISKATRDAVFKAAAELNYQPNQLAAALRNGRSNLIGIIVPTADRTFFASVIRGIEEVANQLNYKVIICQSYDDQQKEAQTIDTLISAGVDGIMASFGKRNSIFSHFTKAIEKGIPVVLFDRSTDRLNVNQIVIDDFLGAYQVVNHLLNQGCRNIVHFTSTTKISIYKERLKGYQEALKEHKIQLNEDLIVESNLQLDDGRRCTRELLDKNIEFDAIFSASDYAAMGAMQVLKESGFRIPQEIALAGFANEPFTSFTDPTLTTVDQLSITMGHVAGKLFFDYLKEEVSRKPQKIVLEPKLIIRQSSLKNG